MSWYMKLIPMMLGLSSGLDNGLGILPAMGYNSWYDLMGDLNEDNLKRTADMMEELGLIKIGYEYFNLDDIWAKGRNSDGTVYADPSKFPSKTLKPLADYVHDKGMKFGTYTDRGDKTCGGRPGSLNHEVLDAKVYAEWGVDYVKEDSCHASGDHETSFKQYGAMRDALNATGRPIYFSLCGWNAWYAPVGQLLGNSWRIGPDDTNWGGVLKNIDINAGLGKYSGPGGWNDPCLLLAEDEHGRQRVTETQSRAQFSMWAVMASPLLISGNLRNMSETNIETYQNTEVIAVNQDPWGRQGQRLAGGPLSGGRSNPPAVVLPCDGSKVQKWEYNVVMDNFISQDGICLNVDNCGTDLIYYPCVTTGGTCCGKNCYQNEQFQLNTETSQLYTLLRNSVECVEVTNQGMSLVKCSNGTDIPANQRWLYDNQTKEFKNQKKCLSRQAATFNVWGRQLWGGSWALVFLNIDDKAADVTCDTDCLSLTNLSDKVAVRDLWAHKDIGNISISKPLVVKNLPANGGSAMYKLTPIL